MDTGSFCHPGPGDWPADRRGLFRLNLDRSGRGEFVLQKTFSSCSDDRIGTHSGRTDRADSIWFSAFVGRVFGARAANSFIDRFALAAARRDLENGPDGPRD